MEQTNGNRWERPDAPLGTLVYRAGLLSKEKLEAALQEGQRTGRRLGEILLQKGWIEEKDLARLLAGQKGLQYVSLKGRGYEPQAARLLPERVCRYHNAMPIEVSGESVLVAIADPTDDGANDEIRDELKRGVSFVVATASEIRSAIDDVFGSGQGAQLAVAGAAPTAISPIVADSGLRIATPVPDPLPEPEHAETEPVLAEPEPEPMPSEPVLTPVPSPEPYAAPAPDLEPDALPEAEPQPAASAGEPEFEPLPVLPGHETPAPERALEPVEPTIERYEEAHVSVAFHAAAPAEPAAEPEPSVRLEPDAAPRLAAEPEHQHEPEHAPDPEPEHEPEPEPEPVLAASERPHDSYRLVINLEGDEEVDVALFADESEAVAAARELVAGIAKDGEWPQVGTKFLPPDRIVSVEIREKAVHAGNGDGTGWGASS